MPSTEPTARHRDRTQVLVLDAEERATLAVARSLVRSGFAVSVVSRAHWSLAGASRSVASYVIREDPLSRPAEYVQAVAAVARRIDARVLIPVTDASASAVLEFRHLVPEATRIPFASRQTYLAASDKIRVLEIASELGLGLQDTVVVTGPSDQAPDDPRLYPAFIKPHRSVAGDTARVKTGVRYAQNRPECAAALEGLPVEAFPVLVQRRVHGPGEGVFIARWHGRTIARFAHRRLREKPPSGGVSVYRESIAMDANVLAACEVLLDRLAWEGVAMIEGKRDLETGRWVLMEINGRFWGSLQLAVDAGADFPSLLVRAAMDGPPERIPEWRPGVRLRWEWGDVDHFLLRMIRSRRRLAISPQEPGRLRVLRDFLTHRPGRDHLEVFRLADPLPFVVETMVRFGFIR